MKHLNTLLSLIFILIVGVLGVATFVEQAQGSSYSSQHIYHTWWFFLLWALLAAVSAVMVCRHRLWRRLPVMLLHASFLVILCGAALSFFTSHEGTLHLRQGKSSAFYLLKDTRRPARLPFETMRLQSFTVECYPGTSAPQDFVSRIACRKADGGTLECVVSMNNILQTDGYRFYQSSFDSDLKGSILTVNYDPWGTPVTYAGYVLLALSVIWVLFAKGETFRSLLRSPLLKKGGVMVVLFVAGAVASPMSARSVPTINAEKAERLARMPIVYNDRVAPLSTLAHDFTTKLYGKSRYKGLSAEQVLYGWLQRPDVWKDEPMLKIKDSHLRQQLGIEGDYARFSDLFDAYQNYKLAPLVREGQEDKAVRELDEKVGIILMLTNGSLIRPAMKATVSASRISAEIFYNEFPMTKILAMGNLTLGILLFLLLILPPSRYRKNLLCGGRCLLWVSFLAQAFVYGLRWYISGRVPLGNGYETMLFMSLATVTVSMVLCRRFLVALPFGFLLSGFTLLVSFLGQMSPQITPLMPVLQSPLLSVHVSIIMMSYALLAFTMLCGVMAMVQMRMGRVGQVEVLTLLSRLLLYPAVFLLAVGIFIGAVWANVSWGKYWSWDPKEVWALITLMVYAIPLHRSVLFPLHGAKAYHIYMVAAFLCVLMTYFGVNYFLGGMHSYA